MVQWTELPDGEDPASLVPAPEADLRVVHALAPPDMDRKYHVEHELLAALGKRPDVAGAQTRDEGAALISAWLATYRTEWVVLFSAQDIPAVVADAAVEPVAAGGARLLLVADPGYGQQTSLAFAGWAPTRTSYRAWADEHHVTLQPVPLAPARTPQAPRTATQPGPWQDLSLPRTDWPWFRAACRDTLSPDRFALVDDYYLRVLRTVRTGTPPPPAPSGSQRRWDQDAVRDPLLDLLAPFMEGLVSREQGVVLLRAAQAALVPLGVLLRAEVEPFLQSLSDTMRPPALTAGQWRALRAYRDPWRALACALPICGMTQDTVYDLTCGEVACARAAGTRVLRDTTVAADAWEFVVAQHLLRRSEGAGDADPLLDMGRAATTIARRNALNDLGIAFGTEERGRRDESARDTWLRAVRRRITLTDIR